MTIKELKLIVGGLSEPSKMPCYSWSIPAEDCVTGAKLAEVPGTVCFDCYALKFRYVMPVQKAAMKRRLRALQDPRWVGAMAELINRLETPPKGSGYFRWFDSGDIQSVAHLLKIVEVVELTPGIVHWLPTRETKMVGEYLKKHGEFPENLTVRISTNKIDSEPTGFMGLPTSTVVTGEATCVAKKQGNKCLDCRDCWSKAVGNVSYQKH